MKRDGMVYIDTETLREVSYFYSGPYAGCTGAPGCKWVNVKDLAEMRRKKKGEKRFPRS